MTMEAPVYKPKSVLMTPDPYHVPGYGGFCPQFEYQIGETFGQTTSRLLRDPQFASSGRLVLANLHPGKEADHQRETRAEVIRRRTASWGDQKLMERMVPGYTGFIPKSQHYFGKRYAENCVNAISDFEEDQRSQKVKAMTRTQLPSYTLGDKDKDTTCARYATPLQPIAREPKPYIPKNPPQHTMSPYFMANENPEKLLMSGYTGFVPRARGLLGAGYPQISHNALNEFTDAMRKHKELGLKPIQLHRPEEPKVPTRPIYPMDTGMVPLYTGHIPGQKFRYGRTFGHSTKNALANQATAACS